MEKKKKKKTGGERTERERNIRGRGEASGNAERRKNLWIRPRMCTHESAKPRDRRFCGHDFMNQPFDLRPSVQSAWYGHTRNARGYLSACAILARLIVYGELAHTRIYSRLIPLPVLLFVLPFSTPTEDTLSRDFDRGRICKFLRSDRSFIVKISSAQSPFFFFFFYYRDSQNSVSGNARGFCNIWSKGAARAILLFASTIYSSPPEFVEVPRFEKSLFACKLWHPGNNRIFTDNISLRVNGAVARVR